MSSGDKKWLYILGGVGALVGGALLYNYFSGGSEEDENSALVADLENLGQVQKEANGAVRLDDFINLFKIITKHAKKKISQIKQEYATKRREHLKNEDEAEYEKCVKEQMQVEEFVYQEVATQALEHQGIQEQDFMLSQQTHMANQKFQQAMMQVQMGLDEEEKDWQPSITRDKAKEIF